MGTDMDMVTITIMVTTMPVKAIILMVVLFNSALRHSSHKIRYGNKINLIF
jgi:hypothetical protein